MLDNQQLPVKQPEKVKPIKVQVRRVVPQVGEMYNGVVVENVTQELKRGGSMLVRINGQLIDLYG